MENIEKIDLNNVDWKSSKEFFESLKDELEKLEDRDESYNFTWVGKRKSIVEAGAPINKILRPDVEASKDFDSTENMLIVGDNLDALKILQESYLGQVKMIYIDPPYNTGHDFIYHDNFTTRKDEYEDNSINEDGDRIIAEEPLRENSRSSGRFHSDWLSMIYPRLKLARNLLSDDGVIFISIDDNEQVNLKKICDEIFGEENFINNFLYLHGKGKKDTWSRTSQQYTLAYAKNKEILPEWREEQAAKGEFSNPDNDPRGPWFSGSISFSEERSNRNNIKYFTIESPSGIKWTRQFMCTRQEMDEYLAKQLIYFGPAPAYDHTPRIKIFPTDVNEVIPSNLLSEFDSTRKTQADLDTLMNGHVFDNPKPVNLITHLIKISGTAESGGIVLDFFAGSGSTAQSVFKLNSTKGANLKFILVQYPENLDKSLSQANGLARKTLEESVKLLDSLNKKHELSEITAERLRRAGNKIQKEHPDAKVDTGFRVFRIDSSNEKDGMRKTVDEYTQESMLDMVDNIKPDRTPLDLLFGAIYTSALPFDAKLETKQIGNNTVYIYDYLGEGSGLIACFDDNVSEETIREMAKLKAFVAVFKDSSFADSAAKINLSEHFRILSVDTKVKVI